uniref:Uncharacterized protein n=1 Tax=Trichobilharzia regenti TaxID=157069 RepID=A0AA85IZI9_TRIRE|nr:unnamed protein product [Trichobilharzia regenti]
MLYFILIPHNFCVSRVTEISEPTQSNSRTRFTRSLSATYPPPYFSSSEHITLPGNTFYTWSRFCQQPISGRLSGHLNESNGLVVGSSVPAVTNVNDSTPLIVPSAIRQRTPHDDQCSSSNVVHNTASADTRLHLATGGECVNSLPFRNDTLSGSSSGVILRPTTQSSGPRTSDAFNHRPVHSAVRNRCTLVPRPTPLSKGCTQPATSVLLNSQPPMVNTCSQHLGSNIRNPVVSTVDPNRLSISSAANRINEQILNPPPPMDENVLWGRVTRNSSGDLRFPGINRTFKSVSSVLRQIYQTATAEDSLSLQVTEISEPTQSNSRTRFTRSLSATYPPPYFTSSEHITLPGNTFYTWSRFCQQPISGRLSGHLNESNGLVVGSSVPAVTNVNDSTPLIVPSAIRQRTPHDVTEISEPTQSNSRTRFTRSLSATYPPPYFSSSEHITLPGNTFYTWSRFCQQPISGRLSGHLNESNGLVVGSSVPAVTNVNDSTPLIVPSAIRQRTPHDDQCSSSNVVHNTASADTRLHLATGGECVNSLPFRNDTLSGSSSGVILRPTTQSSGPRTSDAFNHRPVHSAVRNRCTLVPRPTPLSKGCTQPATSVLLNSQPPMVNTCSQHLGSNIRNPVVSTVDPNRLSISSAANRINEQILNPPPPMDENVLWGRVTRNSSGDLRFPGINRTFKSVSSVLRQIYQTATAEDSLSLQLPSSAIQCENEANIRLENSLPNSLLNSTSRKSSTPSSSLSQQQQQPFGVLRCLLCKFKTNDKQRLKMHLVGSGRTVVNTKCGLCGQLLSIEQPNLCLIKAHILLHLGCHIMCPQCGFTKQLQSIVGISIDNSQQQQQQSTSFTIETSSFEELTNHMKVIHGANTPPGAMNSSTSTVHPISGF